MFPPHSSPSYQPDLHCRIARTKSPLLLDYHTTIVAVYRTNLHRSDKIQDHHTTTYRYRTIDKQANKRVRKTKPPHSKIYHTATKLRYPHNLPPSPPPKPKHSIPYRTIYHPVQYKYSTYPKKKPKPATVTRAATTSEQERKKEKRRKKRQCS